MQEMFSRKLPHFNSTLRYVKRKSHKEFSTTTIQSEHGRFFAFPHLTFCWEGEKYEGEENAKVKEKSSEVDLGT